MTAVATQTPFAQLYAGAQDILTFLNTAFGPRTAAEIGAGTGYPAASVRRWIGTLRDHGYNVVSTPTGYKFNF